MGSKTTVQETKIPEPTPEELSRMSTETALMDILIEKSGFNINRETISTPENPELIDSLINQRATLGDTLKSKEQQLQKINQSGGFSNNQQQLEAEILQLRNQIGNIETKLTEEQAKVKTEVKVNLTEREDPRVEDLISQGKTEEAATLKTQLGKEKLAKLDAQDDIDTLYMDAAKKFLSGDLSITPEQEAHLNASSERIRGPVLNMIKQMEDTIGSTTEDTLKQISARESATQDQISNTFKGVSEQLSQFETRIRDTGLNVEEALIEAEARAKETGGNMTAALDKVVDTSRKLAEQGLFESTRKLRVQSAELSARLGRPETDPAFLRELNEQVLEETANVQLNLSLQEAQGRLQISERTGAALESIQRDRTSFVESQGRRMEDVSVARGELARDTGLRREGVTDQAGSDRVGVVRERGLGLQELGRARAGLEERILTNQESQRMSLAQGLPLSQIQAGQSIQGQQAGLQGQQFGQIGSTLGATQTGLQRQFAERASQPTTTTTQSGGFFSDLLSGLGVAGSAFGATATGIGAFKYGPK